MLSPVHCSFVNPLPIRAAPTEGATFADLASSAAAAILGALFNSLLPLQEVVEAAGVVRQPGINPLYQVGDVGLSFFDCFMAQCSGPSLPGKYFTHRPLLPPLSTC